MPIRRVLFVGTFLACVRLLSAETLTFNASLRPQIEANDHIEFGISIDPSTVPESRESAQLKGVRSTIAAELRGTLVLDRLTLQGSLAPALDDYRGEDGFLDQFDARRVPIDLSASYRFADTLPPFGVRIGATRLERNAGIYDNWDSFVGVRFGELLAYEYRRRRFDETAPREDYLLIDSVRHELRTAVRIAFDRVTRLDLSHRFQRERYGTNLSPLLSNGIRVERGFQRLDRRQFVRAAFVRVFGRTFVGQVGANVLWNGSNAAFYDFRSVEGFLVGFLGVGDRSWLRAQVSRARIDFFGRRLSGGIAGPVRAEHRRDAQTRLQLRGEWGATDRLALTATLDLTRNRTNETRPQLAFLNFTQRIATLGVTARY